MYTHSHPRGLGGLGGLGGTGGLGGLGELGGLGGRQTEPAPHGFGAAVGAGSTVTDLVVFRRSTRPRAPSASTRMGIRAGHRYATALPSKGYVLRPPVPLVPLVPLTPPTYAHLSH